MQQSSLVEPISQGKGVCKPNNLLEMPRIQLSRGEKEKKSWLHSHAEPGGLILRTYILLDRLPISFLHLMFCC